MWASVVSYNIDQGYLSPLILIGNTKYTNQYYYNLDHTLNNSKESRSPLVDLIKPYRTSLTRSLSCREKKTRETPEN